MVDRGTRQVELSQLYILSLGVEPDQYTTFYERNRSIAHHESAKLAIDQGHSDRRLGDQAATIIDLDRTGQDWRLLCIPEHWSNDLKMDPWLAS